MTAHTATFARAGLPRLTRVELRKMTDTRSGFWLMIVIALLTSALVAITVIFGETEDRTFHGLFQGSVWVVSLLLPVLGILAVTSEWSQRTGLTTFSLVPERERVIVAKMAAAAGLALYAVVACLLTAAIGNAFSGGSWDMPLSAIAHGALFELASVLIGLAFGLVLMSPPLAIVLYYVIPTAWAVLFGTIHALEKPGEWLDLNQTLAPLVDGGMTGTAWAKLGTSLALWLGAFLAVGLWRLRRSELK